MLREANTPRGGVATPHTCVKHQRQGSPPGGATLCSLTLRSSQTG